MPQKQKAHKAHKEQKAAILIVWFIISLITTTIILFPFVFDRQTILENSPKCISKNHFNIDCSLCGMTRAFIEISNGNFSTAYELNKGSLYIYSSFILNIIIFTTYIIYKTKLKKRNAHKDVNRIDI